MSLQDVIIGPDCGVDIYEEPSEDKWVECEIRKSNVALMIAVPVLVIAALLCIFLGSTGVKIFGVLFCTIMIGVLFLNHFYWIPIASRNTYQRYQKELKSYIDNGMTRAQAIKEIKDEGLKREKIAAEAASARAAARTNAAGMFAIARALRR